MIVYDSESADTTNTSTHSASFSGGVIYFLGTGDYLVVHHNTTPTILETPYYPENKYEDLLKPPREKFPRISFGKREIKPNSRPDFISIHKPAVMARVLNR